MLRTLVRTLALVGPLLFPFTAASPAQEAQVGRPGFAASAPRLYTMLDAMGLYEVLAIMATENIRGAADLEAEMFPGEGGAAWRVVVTRIHSADRLIRLFEDSFPQDRLSAAQIAEITAFMQSDTGRRLVAGEIAARRQFLDDGALDRGSEILMRAMEDGDARLDALMAFNEVNDLVERNVSGALNARFAFYRGLADGGAFEVELPETLMLAEVWGQEAELRQSTVEWLFSYQVTAYADIGEADLLAYVELSRSDAGRALNAALFAAFDEMLGLLSYELGVAAASFIAGEDT